jgi:3-oxoadipate enol-lactonase
MPVLAVVGEQDRIVSPSVMRAMADAIPGAEFEVVSGAGHVPPLERPGLVTDRIARFLSRV